tara:strand:- start:3008 stop:3586 length:579 start_codon:yes stop_codon:yes gene_type:complete
MSCLIASGRGHFCQGQVGGIKKIYLANWYDANRITDVTASATTGAVSDITTAGSLDFFEFSLDRQTSSFNQTITTGGGGAINYEQSLDLHMSHDSEESWARMQNVVESVFQAIILDNNGVYYLAGVDNGISVNGGTYAHGGDVAFTDYVGYVLQMIGSEPFPAYNLTTTSPFKSWSGGTLTLSATTYNTAQI